MMKCLAIGTPLQAQLGGAGILRPRSGASALASPSRCQGTSTVIGVAMPFMSGRRSV